MPSKLSLAGHTFGRLLVMAEHGRDRHGAVLWRCACACGRETIARGSQLRSGVTASCGCGIALRASQPKTHGATGTPLYQRWRAMMARCSNPKNSEYRNYGGRGISVCSEWMTFEGFASDMSAKFEPHLELDREDFDGNYEPSNCRWITKKAQQHNKRSNHRVSWCGRTLTATAWAELLGIEPNTLIYRLRRGWPAERALSKGARTDVLLELANPNSRSPVPPTQGCAEAPAVSLEGPTESETAGVASGERS